MNADSYIDTESYDDVLEHELTHFLVREAVGVAMESPLREPILEGVERSDGDTSDAGDAPAAESTEESETGGRSLPLTGLAVLVVLAVAYASRRRGGE